MLGQNSWTNPFGNVNFFALFKTSIFWSKNDFSIQNIEQRFFSAIISVKNSDKRKFNFWTKSMD